MDLNWTTIVSSAVTASIIGIFQYLALRYTSRIVDHVEKQIKKNGKNDNQNK